MSTPVPQLTVHELRDATQRGEPLTILDVREPKEFALCRLDHATLIPLGELPARLSELDKTKPYAVLCRSGVRSERACVFLRQQGFDATNITGGILAWARHIDPTMPTY